jgi:hypothetical protein
MASVCMYVRTYVYVYVCIQDETAACDCVPASALLDDNCDVEGYEDVRGDGSDADDRHEEDQDWFPEDPFADPTIFSRQDYDTSMKFMYPPESRENIDPAILSNVPVIGMGCVYLRIFLTQVYTYPLVPVLLCQIHG